MNKNRSISIFSFLFAFVIQVTAQVPFTSKEIASDFNRGMELFEKEKYPAAIRFFDIFVKSNDRSDNIQVIEAQYYSAVSALKLFNPDASALISVRQKRKK